MHSLYHVCTFDILDSLPRMNRSYLSALKVEVCQRHNNFTFKAERFLILTKRKDLSGLYARENPYAFMRFLTESSP